MSDKIKGLLERLEKADKKAHDTILEYTRELYHGDPRYGDVVAGCIQRAIAARGWAYQVSISFQRTHFGKIATIDPDGAKRFHQDHAADTPAAAILSAYIAAMEASL